MLLPWLCSASLVHKLLFQEVADLYRLFRIEGEMEYMNSRMNAGLARVVEEAERKRGVAGLARMVEEDGGGWIGEGSG